MGQWNPLHDLVSLQDRMNRLFEDASQRRGRQLINAMKSKLADWYPAADVYEVDSRIHRLNGSARHRSRNARHQCR